MRGWPVDPYSSPVCFGKDCHLGIFSEEEEDKVGNNWSHNSSKYFCTTQLSAFGCWIYSSGTTLVYLISVPVRLLGIIVWKTHFLNSVWKTHFLHLVWKTHFPHLVWKTSGLYVLPVRIFRPVRLLGTQEYLQLSEEISNQPDTTSVGPSFMNKTHLDSV